LEIRGNISKLPKFVFNFVMFERFSKTKAEIFVWLPFMAKFVKFVSPDIFPKFVSSSSEIFRVRRFVRELRDG
jgi:hypothetical protein